MQFLLNILSFISIEWDGILVNYTDYELGGFILQILGIRTRLDDE